MERLDEKALRRPGFCEGSPIVLADGQEWIFPRPWMRLRPRRDKETGRIQAGGGMSFGEAFEDVMDALAETDEEDISTRIGYQFEMAVMLLCQNYELSDRDVSRLLVLDLEDDASRKTWADVCAVIMGEAPKRLADGSDVP